MDEEASCKLMADKDKLNQDNCEGKTSSIDHLTEDEFEKKFKALLETQKLLIQHLDKHQVASNKCMRKMQGDFLKYLQNDEKLRTLLLGVLTEQKYYETLMKLEEEQKGCPAAILQAAIDAYKDEVELEDMRLETQKVEEMVAKTTTIVSQVTRDNEEIRGRMAQLEKTILDLVGARTSSQPSINSAALQSLLSQRLDAPPLASQPSSQP